MRLISHHCGMALYRLDNGGIWAFDIDPESQDGTLRASREFGHPNVDYLGFYEFAENRASITIRPERFGGFDCYIDEETGLYPFGSSVVRLPNADRAAR